MNFNFLSNRTLYRAYDNGRKSRRNDIISTDDKLSHAQA